MSAGFMVAALAVVLAWDAALAAEGGGVGACHGILPLAQVVYESVADEPFGELYYFAACND